MLIEGSLGQLDDVLLWRLDASAKLSRPTRRPDGFARAILAPLGVEGAIEEVFLAGTEPTGLMELPSSDDPAPSMWPL
ncbi:hypothetical protein [Sorangium sp. So ce233]|uniref:hypothetical protein n=1 Tax=Sorangium sp. So ce233 TaxID=3133290 RepID=UPI003F6431BB